MGQLCCNEEPQLQQIEEIKFGANTSQKEEQIQALQQKTTRVSFKKFKTSKVINSIKDHYSFGQILGSGSFGTVYLATNLDTKSTVAIKKVKKSKIAENEVYYDLMESELKILLDTDHPHITRVFEVCENKNNFFIVMELMDGGSLWNRIEKIKHFSEDHVASIVHQIMLALNYMHQQHVTHRDLKLDNLMCKGFDEESQDVQIKLTDFGFATICDPNEKMDQCLGTPVYMAPELCRMEKYDQRVDVWSLGIIAYLLLSGKKPFNLSCNDSAKVTRDAILDAKLEFNQPEWSSVTELAKNFVSQCLNKDVNNRPSVQLLFEHPWIAKWIKDPQIKSETALEITKNLKSFQEEGILKTSVISILSNLISTSDELCDYIKMFEGLDKSHNGFISVDDLQLGLKSSSQFLAIRDSEWDEILQSIDENGDGKLDFTEFVSAVFDRQKLLTQQNIQKAFQLLDKDEDGLISMDDLQNVFGDRNEEFADTWAQILQESDLNGDGRISFEEFTKAMEKTILKQIPIKN